MPMTEMSHVPATEKGNFPREGLTWTARGPGQGASSGDVFSRPRGILWKEDHMQEVGPGSCGGGGRPAVDLG